MKQRDFTSARAKEALLKDKDDMCCGNCCWFYAEDTDGWGFCACQKNRDIDMEHCSDMCEDDFVSREEIRHHMYVLLAMKYWFDGNHLHNVSPHEMHEAMAFAYKYMKVFSKL